MNFCEAMDSLKAGNKVTREGWQDGLYFILESGKVNSYQPIIEKYLYTEDIMVSDGWISDRGNESKTFCELILDLQLGSKAWMTDWHPSFYIYLDKQDGLIIHKMINFNYHPSFDDFKANDWIEV